MGDQRQYPTLGARGGHGNQERGPRGGPQRVCEDKKGKGSTKKFTNDEIVGFQVDELRVNSYIKVGKKFCQPAAQEIKSAWSEWERGKNGSKATRAAQMTGALVSGSDFEGASMRGVNMLLVNGRYANLQKTLQHAANFR